MAPDAPDYFNKTFPTGPLVNFLRWLFGRPLQVYWRWIMRSDPAYYSIVKKHIILQFDYVQEAFSRYDELQVPHDFKTDKLGWEPPFLLARRENNDKYKEIYRDVQTYWHADQHIIRDKVRLACEYFILNNRKDQARPSGSQDIDAVWDYMLPVFWNVVEEHYGIRWASRAEKRHFTHDLFVISSFFFGSVEGKDSKQGHAQEAFTHATGVLRRLVNEAEADPSNAVGVLRKMVDHNRPTKDIVSWMLGMILGFIPTSGNGLVRALQYFTKNDDARAELHGLLNTVPNVGPGPGYGGQRPFLNACHEALRLNYILPGLFRIAKTDVELGANTRRPYKIKKGEVAVLSAQTGMFDPRRVSNPKVYDPSRPYTTYLNYGFQMHYCVGWVLSDIIMEETFRALVMASFGPPENHVREWRGGFPWVETIRINVP